MRLYGILPVAQSRRSSRLQILTIFPLSPTSFPLTFCSEIITTFCHSSQLCQSQIEALALPHFSYLFSHNLNAALCIPLSDHFFHPFLTSGTLRSIMSKISCISNAFQNICFFPPFFKVSLATYAPRVLLPMSLIK